MQNTRKEVYYKSYLSLDKILDAQYLESEAMGQPAHDEMLFIVIHQAYELWFKQVLFELNSVQKIFDTEQINDNGPDLQIAVHRMKRVATILQVLVHQIDILETMTPLDFLDFRDMLRPASGFQSYQFKMVEALMGLKFENRHELNYYVSHLHKEELDAVREVEQKRTLLELVNHWLERMPFFDERYWNNYKRLHAQTDSLHVFWNDYRTIYEESLAKEEEGNLIQFDALFLAPHKADQKSLSVKANGSALFIMLYRDYPMLQLPYQLINTLLDIDELMAMWRYRHLNMVHRMIGARVGTGGSSGKDYLRGAMDKHYVYKEFADLNSFLIERRKLPDLSDELKRALGYTMH